MFINDIFENEDELFSEPRNEMGKAIRNGWWGSAAGQCVRLGIRNPQVERGIIPGIVRTLRNGDVAGGATWYEVRDWYEKFIAPNDWPELIQYVSTLKAKGPVNAALEHLLRFYAITNPQRTAEVKQLIQDKKAADAAVLSIQMSSQGQQRWPEMEPYIMVSPRAAMWYAAGVLNGRWPEAEPYIATDKVSWSMYAARALNTNNSTRAGRAARDAAQQEALSRLPDGHKKRIAEDDDMFASSKRVKTAQIIKRVLDEKYARYEEIYNERDPRKFVDLSDELQEIDYLRNELARGGLKAYVHGLDSVSSDMVGSIGTELACNHDIGTQDLKDEYLDESEDDMFADSKRVNAQKAIKDVLDSNYDRYMEHYNEIDQEQPGAEDMLNYYGDYLSDYDYLRGELARAGVVGFLNGLEMVQHSVIDAVDGDLAIKHKVFLSNLEDQYIDDQLEEDTDPYDDEDMFASSSRITLTRDLADITARLAKRYTDYAASELVGLNDEEKELYDNEAHALHRASIAFLTGLRAGFKELEDVEDPTTWEDLGDIASRKGVDLSELADQYDAGELSESDDDMFAPSSKPNLRKISSDRLRMLYQLSKGDSRPEYAAVHKLQMAAIRAELERRNSGYVPTLEEQVNNPIGFHKGK